MSKAKQRTRPVNAEYKAKDSTRVEMVNPGRGYAVSPDTGVISFEVQGLSDRDEIMSCQNESIYQRYISRDMTLKLDNFTVPLWGEGHNLYPQEVYRAVSENKLLPEVIRKQRKFLFGKGPRLYRETIQEEADQAKRVRIPWEDKNIQEWLEGWEEKGYPHYWEYLNCLIDDYYHVETCISKYNFNLKRRIQGHQPIDALTYVGSDQARLAAKDVNGTAKIKDSDCRYVVVGDWLNISASKYEVYHRFDPSSPLKYNSSIAFNYDKTFTKWTYAFNSWYKGLKEYLRASQLAPKYLNSYLKNALNAHIHVQIPGTWYESQKTILQQICSDNLMNSEMAVQTGYRGVKLINEKNEPLPFYEAMMDELISCELRRITSLMSGEGKNQGKLYATTSWAGEGWKFEEFPGKFKDFFDTVIKYDERADKVIVAGKGVPSSISNVDGSGILSKSGSEAWYNYLLYVMTLTLDEHFILKELNRAIHINFPHAKELGLKLGFWIDIPAKLQDTTVSERPAGIATAENI